MRHIGQHVMRATRHGSHHSNSQCHSQWTRLDGPKESPKESNSKERKKGKQGKCWPYARRQLMPRKMPKIVALVGPKSKRKENGNTKQDESAGKSEKKKRRMEKGSTPAENQYTLRHGRRR